MTSNIQMKQSFENLRLDEADTIPAGLTAASNENQQFENKDHTTLLPQTTDGIATGTELSGTDPIHAESTSLAIPSYDLSLIIGLTVGLGIFVIILLIALVCWYIRRRKRVELEQKTTPLHSRQHVQIDIKPVGGKHSRALQYSTVSAMALPSDGDTLQKTDRPIELSEKDDEVFNNGIVPLKDVPEKDETKL